MNDNFTIKGHVVITDDSGKTLVDTHNMIVNDGRTFIRDIIFAHINKKSNASSSDTSSSDNKKIVNIAFIDATKVAAKGDKYSEFSNLYLLNTVNDNNNNDIINADITTEDSFSINFAIKNLKLNTGITDQSSAIYLKINSIGLVGTDNTLLTRASFDDIIMTQAQSYTITYTLSF